MSVTKEYHDWGVPVSVVLSYVEPEYESVAVASVTVRAYSPLGGWHEVLSEERTGPPGGTWKGEFMNVAIERAKWIIGSSA